MNCKLDQEYQNNFTISHQRINNIKKHDVYMSSRGFDLFLLSPTIPIYFALLFIVHTVCLHIFFYFRFLLHLCRDFSSDFSLAYHFLSRYIDIMSYTFCFCFSIFLLLLTRFTWWLSYFLLRFLLFKCHVGLVHFFLFFLIIFFWGGRGRYYIYIFTFFNIFILLSIAFICICRNFIFIIIRIYLWI